MGNCAGILSTCQGDETLNDKNRSINQESIQNALNLNKELEIQSKTTFQERDNY